jgi:CubicO group peptidase (beta-lactamase class C family)
MICKAWLLFLIPVAAAAQASKPGDFLGMLGPLHLKLHLKVDAGGALSGTLDSPDQGANGLPCANFKSAGKSLSFDVPSVGGTWRGTVSKDGDLLQGDWTQGSAMPLSFRRDVPFAAAEKPSRVDGTWLGELGSGRERLRIQVKVKSDRAGKLYCSLDSLDQEAMGLPCERVRLEGDRFSFEIPSVNGRWSGTISKDGNELDGKWFQGGVLALKLARKAAPVELKAPEPPKLDEALPPVPVGELKAVLDRDLGSGMKGVAVIGVVQHGTRRILVYGSAQENSIFEIGSITKTFTGLIAAQMAVQQKVRLDESVRALLPSGAVPKPDGAEITLLDLATQHSGLPRLPDNLKPANGLDPYADYRAANLYEFLSRHGLTRPADAGFEYSNLGFGLLGFALANRAGLSYGALLAKEIAGPLGMTDTSVTLSPEQAKRLVREHDPQRRDGPAWSFDALAGAGAIRSTAPDMLTYLEAHLHPDRIRSSSPTLARAIEMSHELRAEALPSLKIALAWLYDTRTGSYWHDGATGGYSSFAFFNPKSDCAGVVLYDEAIDPKRPFANRLGEHVAARLLGKPAVSVRE